ncbi:MAG: hypothetical protein K8T10_01685 [Candidatus Eremiobacteraeota bacterium]|nr:hypothetical protein [Candidatus Eremiobacteraeota bacterium]
MSFRNRITIDDKTFGIKSGVFFLWLTRTTISIDECNGIVVRCSKKGKCTIFFTIEDRIFNTLLSGNKRAMEDLAGLISKKSGIPIVEDNINIEKEGEKIFVKIAKVKVKKFPE